MEVLGVIPARYGSTRFPGKPLAFINGKPMLQWVIEASLKAEKITRVLVATDDQRIADLATQVGVEAVMTESDLPTGSDRVWQAVESLSCDIVLSIQGDEPLLDPQAVDHLVEPFERDSKLEMATLARDLNEEDLASRNTAKIVLDQEKNAIYFSRLPIPFSRDNSEANNAMRSLKAAKKHIGLYAYRKAFLKRYCEHGPCEIERIESLEQLRALYLGAKIRVVEVDTESWGVDSEEDIQKIERLMQLKR